MQPTEAAAYREYAAARMDHLRRAAYLLCGDWHTADDLVATTLTKLFRRWRRASRVEHLDAFVRRMLVRVWLDERRRPWRRERSYHHLPDRAGPGGAHDLGTVTDRIALLASLATLPPRRRAVLVLRYFCDLSVEDTAATLGISEGTVKSQTARALAALRAHLGGAVHV